MTNSKSAVLPGFTANASVGYTSVENIGIAGNANTFYASVIMSVFGGGAVGVKWCSSNPWTCKNVYTTIEDCPSGRGQQCFAANGACWVCTK